VRDGRGAAGAGSERSEERLAHRSGYYDRSFITRVGKLELRIPQDRKGLFRTELFERSQRSEKALFAALSEMYIQGVSTGKVKAITEELCGHSFSASSISEITKKLDGQLEAFAKRRLEQTYGYVIVDARYERIREHGTIQSRAVLIAIGINDEGRRWWSLLNARAGIAGRSSCSVYGSAGCMESSSWSAMIMQG
jgi:putative transposase